MKREVKLKAIRQPKGKEEKTMKVYFNFKEYIGEYDEMTGF